MKFLFFQLYLLPFSSYAQITFERTYGGSSGEIGRSVQQTQDGGYVIAGTTFSFGAGSGDLYLVKTDSLGDTLWTKTFGGIFFEDVYSVQQTTDGGFIITGITASFGAGDFDIYLIRTDSLGETLWTKTYGGSDDDVGWSVQQTLEGGYVIAGQLDIAGLMWISLIKTDAEGNIIWIKSYDGMFGFSVKQTRDEGYVITGRSSSLGGNVLLIKTNAFGDLLWTETYGGSLFDEGSSVQQTFDGGYVIAGLTESFGAGARDCYMVKTDSLGNTLWTRTFGGASFEECKSVQQTSDGNFIMTGSTHSFGNGSFDVYLVKVNSSGDLIWTKTYGGSSGDQGLSVQQTSDGGFIIAGRMFSNEDIHGNVYLIKTESFVLCKPVEPPLVKSQGYWRRQCMEDPHEDICSLVVSIHTLSDHFDEFDCPAVCDLMKVDPPENDMCRKAERQFMALLLNVASGKLSLCNCLTGGRQVKDVLLEIESLLSSLTILNQNSLEHAACVRAMTLAEDINSGESLVNCNTGHVAKIDNFEKRDGILLSLPNPFVKQTLIQYEVQKDDEVQLNIYDIKGRLVRTFVDRSQESGVYGIQWDGLDDGGGRVPSGIYFYRLEAGSSVWRGKMTLVN